MEKLTISMVVLTRDRPALLKDCLDSITRQTVPPIEVIVVDDSIREKKKSRQIIETFDDKLPITLLQSRRKSIPSARDTGAKRTRADIVLYLDDDLIAPPTYIASMVKHFRSDPTLTAVMGRIINRVPQNIYASVQYAYYQRGLEEYFGRITGPRFVASGRMLDCEVTGIRRSVVKTLGFPLTRPNRYRNDDVDLGLQLLAKGKKILFDPSIVIQATPRTSLWPLLATAFWNGYSDAYTEDVYSTNLRSNHTDLSTLVWILDKARSQKHQFSRAGYGMLLFLFPLMSRLGRLSYWLLPNL